MVTVIDGVTSPLLHVPPLFPESITLSTSHNVVGPPAVIVGVTGTAFTVTFMAADNAL